MSLLDFLRQQEIAFREAAPDDAPIIVIEHWLRPCRSLHSSRRSTMRHVSGGPVRIE